MRNCDHFGRDKACFSHQQGAVDEAIFVLQAEVGGCTISSRTGVREEVNLFGNNGWLDTPNFQS